MRTRIQICGSVVVQVDGRRIDGDLPGRQGQLLLVYLAANRDRAVTRDELIEALWPRGLPARPESALSVLLSKVRSVLGPASIEGRSQVRLALTPVAIDLEAAAKCVHDAESAVAREDWPGAWGPARVALHTSRRGILTGFDAPWIIELRARLDDIRLRALSCVAVSSLRMGGPELPAAERAARSLVTLSPYRETGHRFLMEALAAQGNTAEALRVFDDLRRLLHEELGTVPGGDLQALHKRLLGEGDLAAGAPDESAVALPGGLVALLFTDLVGSTELLERLGDAGAEAVRRDHFGLLREAIAACGGREVKTLGDGVMAAFGSAVEAVGCAVAVQRAAGGGGRQPPSERLPVRIGLHVGEPVRDEDDFFGTAVVVARRLCDAAAGGQILASDLVRGLVEPRREHRFRAVGELALKGLQVSLPAFEVAWDDPPPGAGRDGATGGSAPFLGDLRPPHKRPWERASPRPADRMAPRAANLSERASGETGGHI